jgi:hypothetical protein
MDRAEYLRLVLDAYRSTPGVAGVVRRADRLLAAQLHERGVPFETVENAFVLAASRRLARPEGAAPLGTIRSLAYFSPVINEVLESKVSSQYFAYLRHRLKQSSSSPSSQE